MTDLVLDAKPSVSVILCTYNRAAYLKRCIDSVFAQTFTDFELIVIDDGSEDSTFDIVNQYVKISVFFVPSVSTLLLLIAMMLTKENI